MTEQRRLWRSPWTILGVALALVAALNLFAPSRSTKSITLAADNAQADGGLALSLWLQRADYRVATTSTEPDLTRLASAGTTLMLLAEGSDISPNRVRNYLIWVRRGGRLVVAVDGVTGSAVLDALHLQVVPATGSAVRVVQPVLPAPPVSRLSGTTDTVVAEVGNNLVAAENTGGPVLVEHRMGSGSVWILTAPQLFENGTIAAGQNRRLLLNLAGPSGSTVILVEFVPSANAAQVTDWLTQSIWGVVVLFGLGILVLYRFLSGWRLGPPVVPLNLRHRAAAEYVISLAGLVRRGRGREDVLAIYQRGLEREMRRRYGDFEDARLSREQRERIRGLLTARPITRETDLMARAVAIVEEEAELRRNRA